MDKSCALSTRLAPDQLVATDVISVPEVPAMAVAKAVVETPAVGAIVETKVAAVISAAIGTRAVVAIQVKTAASLSVKPKLQIDFNLSHHHQTERPCKRPSAMTVIISLSLLWISRTIIPFVQQRFM